MLTKSQFTKQSDDALIEVYRDLRRTVDDIHGTHELRSEFAARYRALTGDHDRSDEVLSKRLLTLRKLKRLPRLFRGVTA